MEVVLNGPSTETLQSTMTENPQFESRASKPPKIKGEQETKS